jgi:hypothetical protein
MWLEIGVLCQFTRANPGAVDYQIEFVLNVFEFFKANIRINCAARFLKTRGQIIEINVCIHQRYVQRETALEF